MADSTEFDDLHRRTLFGANASSYADGRPGYPDELFAHLRSSCGLGPGCRVVEVGPGAGQATGQLLAAGAEVTAVELGKEFGSLLTERFAGLPLHVRHGAFETVELAAESFDMLAAATSFHWVQTGAGVAKAASLLRPGGVLALWWNHYGDPARPDPFRDTVQAVFAKHAPEFTDAAGGGAGIGAHPYALDVDTRLAEIDADGGFAPAEHLVLPWSARLSADQLQAFLRSLSHWMALDDDRRELLLGAIEDLVHTEFGGVVERPFLTVLYTARRR